MVLAGIPTKKDDILRGHGVTRHFRRPFQIYAPGIDSRRDERFALVGPFRDGATDGHILENFEFVCHIISFGLSLATVASYASACGQRSFPRPTRSASTSLVLPGNRPENRLGLGSTAAFLKAATRW